MERTARRTESSLPRPWAATRCLGLIAAGPALAVVLGGAAVGLECRREDGRLVITDGVSGTAAVFTFADDAVGRPALRDLHAPGGIRVTRPCPVRPGIDADDHASMHPGVMLCFSDLSGADPWRHKSAVRFGTLSEEPAAADEGVRFAFTADYLAEPQDSPAATVVCRERSTIAITDRLIGGAVVRVIDWDARLEPAGSPVTFADVEEMGFGVRLLKELSPKWGGRYLASHGGRNEAGIFGTQADWCAAAGDVGGRRVGVTLIDRNDAARRSYFHARDYGWLLANPFGRRSYTKGESGAVTLRPGDAIELHFTVLVHGDVPEDALPGIVAAAQRR
ncbi:MAG: DUF6807 family protein [Planctomycetaceae bacterium]